jgi:multidrug efflux pump subunit AcrA (membrane-fusion protein)
LEITGEVVASNSVQIRAMNEGPLAFCPWREGDRVEKGQKVIEIDRPTYRGEVDAAQATLAVTERKLADLKAGTRPEEIRAAREAVRKLEECHAFAKTDMDRIEVLVKDGALPGEAVEKARVNYAKCNGDLMSAREQVAKLEAGPTATQIAVQQALVKEAREKLNLARARLEECVVRAPFTGLITRVYVRPGDVVAAKTPLLDIMDPSSLVVRFSVPEWAASAVRNGAEAKVALDAIPGKTYAAEVVRVYPQLEAGTRTRISEVKLSDTGDGDVVPGMFARVSLAVKTVENAIMVPESAVLKQSDGKKAVFVIADGKASIRGVTVGTEQRGRVQILSGLQSGESVVVAGGDNLKDGMPVRVAETHDVPCGQETEKRG